MILKSFIKRMLNLIGLEVRKVRHSTKDKFIIDDPLFDNSLSRIDEFYSNVSFVEKYLDRPRLEFYSNLIQKSEEKGIVFDNKCIVDVGCGTGHLLLEILKVSNPKELTGIEYSAEAIKRAREFCPKAKFFQHSIYENVYPHSFDIVFCTEVLEHLEYPDKALCNLVGMLSSGGVAIITVPNGRIDTFIGHINFWSPESWRIFVKSQVENCEITFDSVKDSKCNFAIINKR